MCLIGIHFPVWEKESPNHLVKPCISPHQSLSTETLLLQHGEAVALLRKQGQSSGAG